MIDRRSLIAACLGGFVLSAVAVAAEAPEDAAQSAAAPWLARVDAGDYAGSWDQAARVLKGAVKQADWVQTLSGARKPLGRMVARRLKSREYTDKAPAGARMVGGTLYTWGGSAKHVVLQFETAFTARPAAAETVIAVKDADGAWRVSGYSIR